MSKIRKITDERETQTKKIKNEKKKTKQGGTEAIAKRWEINDFVERLS